MHTGHTKRVRREKEETSLEKRMGKLKAQEDKGRVNKGVQERVEKGRGR